MLRIVLFVGFLFCSSLSFAFNVDISPVILKLGSSQQVLSFTVKNKSDAQMTMQLSTAKWNKDANGVDKIVNTSDLIITPPIVTVDPGAEQIVRLGLRSPAVCYTEKTYRVFLRELPVNLKKKSKSSLDMIFNFSLPLFISPVKENKIIDWEIKKISSNKLRVRLLNKGNVHVAVTSLSLQDTNGPIYFLPKLVFGRILSGQSQDWTLSLKKPLASTRITVNATTDWEDKHRELNAVVPVS